MSNAATAMPNQADVQQKRSAQLSLHTNAVYNKPPNGVSFADQKDEMAPSQNRGHNAPVGMKTPPRRAPENMQAPSSAPPAVPSPVAAAPPQYRPNAPQAPSRHGQFQQAPPRQGYGQAPSAQASRGPNRRYANQQYPGVGPHLSPDLTRAITSLHIQLQGERDNSIRFWKDNGLLETELAKIERQLRGCEKSKARIRERLENELRKEREAAAQMKKEYEERIYELENMPAADLGALAFKRMGQMLRLGPITKRFELDLSEMLANKNYEQLPDSYTQSVAPVIKEWQSGGLQIKFSISKSQLYHKWDPEDNADDHKDPQIDAWLYISVLDQEKGLTAVSAEYKVSYWAKHEKWPAGHYKPLISGNREWPVKRRGKPGMAGSLACMDDTDFISDLIEPKRVLFEVDISNPRTIYGFEKVERA